MNNPNSAGHGASHAEARKPSKTIRPLHNERPPRAQAPIVGNPPETNGDMP
jgi:hypothetical protein